MKSRKASMKIKRKVHNEYVLPVMVYGSETWALKKAHMEPQMYSTNSGSPALVSRKNVAPRMRVFRSAA